MTPHAPTSDLPHPLSPQARALQHQADRLARRAERPWLHDEVARRLADKLDAIRLTPVDWIDWGGYLGGGADAVQQRYPQARRWVIEPTAGLAALSERQWHEARHRPWWQAWRRSPSAPVLVAQQDWPAEWPHEGVGLLWANMALHVQADLPAVMAQWHRSLTVDGFLMCSGLGPDTVRELRQLYAELGWAAPTVQFIDMHDLGDALVQAGFADPVMDMERITLTWPDAAALLDELRTWGGNVAWGRHPGLRTPRWRERLMAKLEQRLRRPDGRLGLTVELVYGHAIKPAPRAMVSGETRVTLDDMRRMIRKGPRPH